MLVDQIRKIAESENNPVLRIGSALEMADENLGHRPDDLLLGAQSMTCFGLPIPRSVYQMDCYGLETTWR